MNIENAHRAMLLMDTIPTSKFKMNRWTDVVYFEKRPTVEEFKCKTPGCLAGNLLLAGELDSYVPPNWEINYDFYECIFDRAHTAYWEGEIEVKKDGEDSKVIDIEEYVELTKAYFDLSTETTETICFAGEKGVILYANININDITPKHVQKAILALLKNNGKLRSTKGFIQIVDVSDEELETYMNSHVRKLKE